MLSLRYFDLIDKVHLGVRRYMEVFTYNILPYLLIIISCLLLNFIYLQHLIGVQKEIDRHLLKNHMSEIGNIIVADFKNALGYYNNSDPVFFKRFNSFINSDDSNQNAYFNGNSLYISNNKGLLVFNQKNLISFLKSYLPSYVDYQILFKGVNVSGNEGNRQNINIEKKHQIDKHNNIIIKLGINKIHQGYTSMLNALYFKVFATTAGSIVIAVTLLYFYLKQRRNFKTTTRQLADSLMSIKQQLENTKSGLSRIITALIQEKQSELQLRKMFIRNATAIYLDHNIPNVGRDKKHMNEISNFLFPLVFTEPVNNEEVDVDQVIKDLTGYLAYDATKYDIKFDKQVDILKVQCSNAVFYQILFSLVSNLILLMPKVPDEGLPAESKKKFTVTFLEEKIIIDFETFPLNMQQIASFADKKMPIDAFFLDYKRVLESLKAHNINYSVSAGKTNNSYELDFKRKHPSGKPHLRVVE